MEKFKLKIEARQFFSDNYAKEIQEMKFWENIGISKELLKKVENIYIQYGHEKKLSENAKSISLCGWDGSKKESEFRFTIKIEDISHTNYNKCNIPELMDKMQKVVNQFFKPLLSTENITNEPHNQENFNESEIKNTGGINQYLKDLENWENSLYCNECGNCNRNNFSYGRSVANRQVIFCKDCETDFIKGRKPNEDNY